LAIVSISEDLYPAEAHRSGKIADSPKDSKKFICSLVNSEDQSHRRLKPANPDNPASIESNFLHKSKKSRNFGINLVI
jgi:hypothetical protein